MGIKTERIGARTGLVRGGVGFGRTIVLLAAFLMSAGIGYVGYQRFMAQPAAAPSFQLAAARRGTIVATVSATGSVVPIRQSKLTFASSGTVSQVSVVLGDKVKAGQALAKLDTATLENKLAQAKSSLRSSQIKLDQLKAGSRTEEITAAQASLKSAQSKYDNLIQGATEAEIKAAEQAVTSAQANLIRSQAELAKLKSGLTQDEITVAKADLEKKQATLQKSQADYDRVAWRGDIAARPEAVALQQATADYQASLASYNIKTASAKPEDLAAAEKSVEAATASLVGAQAKLDQLKAGPIDSELQAAQASIASAKSQLVLKTAPATSLDLAALEEQVKNSELSVRQAEIDLSKALLTAPFDGVIAAVSLNVGEQTSGNSFVTLVDPNSVRVDVNVDETDLSKLGLGKTAQVSFDALPDTRLPAKVIAISPNAAVQQGVVTYQISLQVDTPGVFLPAGMTASASIVTDQRENVLTVPNRAVRVQGRSRVVDVVVNGKPEPRQVSVGMSNDQLTEITDGLQEGDQLAIRTTTTAPPRSPGVGGFGAPAGGPVMINAPIRK